MPDLDSSVRPTCSASAAAPHDGAGRRRLQAAFSRSIAAPIDACQEPLDGSPKCGQELRLGRRGQHDRLEIVTKRLERISSIAPRRPKRVHQSDVPGVPSPRGVGGTAEFMAGPKNQANLERAPRIRCSRRLAALWMSEGRDPGRSGFKDRRCQGIWLVARVSNHLLSGRGHERGRCVRGPHDQEVSVRNGRMEGRTQLLRDGRAKRWRQETDGVVAVSDGDDHEPVRS